MNAPDLLPGFLERLRRESIKKLVVKVLGNREFAEDIRDAASLEDYIQYLNSKPNQTTAEAIFLLLPLEDQTNIWQTVRGFNGNAR